MMRILLLVCLMVFSSSAVLANESVRSLQANDEGQVILGQDKSIDDNTYILNDAIPAETYTSIQTMDATVFNSCEFSDGYFDTHTQDVDYTVSGGSANFFKGVIDNSISTGNSMKDLKIKLQEPKLIKVLCVHRNQSLSNGGSTSISLYLEGVQVAYYATQKATNPTTVRHEINKKVDQIIITATPSTAALSTYEMDFYTIDIIDYHAVKNLTVDTDNKEKKATVKFENPESDHYKNHEIYLDDVKLANIQKNESYEMKELELNKQYTVKVRTYYIDGKYIDTVKTFKILPDKTPPGDVDDLQIEQVGDAVKLNWSNPIDEDFSHVRIFKNNIMIADNVKDTTYIDDTIKHNILATYRVVTVDSNKNRSAGKTAQITIIGKEVFDVRAKASNPEKVDISWKNPKRDDFEIVTIYRKKNEEQPILVQMFSLFSTPDPNADYTQLFQTNGTIFNDMTVLPDTHYTYRLATTINNNESSGIIVDVHTPRVAVLGAEIESVPNPDKPDEIIEYVIRWKAPTTGRLKVLIAGVEYTTVTASALQVTIPFVDMRFNVLGSPDVTLVPINDDGIEIGTPSAPGQTTWGDITLSDLGFDSSSLLSVTVALIGLVGLIILLAMSFRLTPKIIELISNAFK